MAEKRSIIGIKRAFFFLAAFLMTNAVLNRPVWAHPHVWVTMTSEIAYDPNGQVEGVREVEIRARVAGILLAQSYQEGAAVKAGELLFRIDPAPYEIAVALAKAQLAQEQARADQAAAEAARQGKLLAERATSAKEAADARSAEAAASAAPIDAASRATGSGCPASAPRKLFRLSPARTGTPSAANSSNERSIAAFCATSLPNPKPGSRTSRLRAIPAASHCATRASRNAATSSTTSP